MGKSLVVCCVAGMLLALTPAEAPAAFPGANGRLVFIQGCCSMYAVHTIAADGTGEAILTDDGAMMPSEPSWSPDGTRIAFAASWEDGSHGPDIFLMNVDGSGVASITHGGRFDGDPAWSPDDSKIVFTSGRHGVDLFVMNADGTGRTRVRHTHRQDADPAWSPDGSSILFTQILRTPGGYRTSDVFAVEPDGTGMTQLTSTRAWESHPAWSPDGSFVVYSRDGDIVRRDLATGAVTRLVATSAWEGYPAVSSDGTGLAWVMNRGPVPPPDYERSKLVVGGIDGSGPTVIDACTLNCHFSAVDWQPLP